jgi:hypothetical protein
MPKHKDELEEMRSIFSTIILLRWMLTICIAVIAFIFIVGNNKFEKSKLPIPPHKNVVPKKQKLSDLASTNQRSAEGSVAKMMLIS